MNQDQNNRNRRSMNGLPSEYEQAYSEQYAPKNDFQSSQRRVSAAHDDWTERPSDSKRYDASENNAYTLPRAMGGADETAVPSDADPSLDYDEELDDDYRAVFQGIAANRSNGVYHAGISDADEDAYSQYGAPQIAERGGDFQVNIEDESFRNLEAVEDESPSFYDPQDEPDEKPARPKKPRKRRRFRLLKALLVVAVIIGLSVYLSSILLSAVYDVFGLQKEDIDVEVDIPQGSSVVDIAEILTENGVISQPIVFRAYSRIKGADDLYQYGTYTMNQKMSYDEIIRMLKEKVPRKDVVNVTIPEGLTAVEIAARLEEAGVCDEDEFLKIVRTADIEHDLVKNVQGGKYRYFKLEGYLFPDTYQFYIGESASSAVRRFLDRFQEVYETEIEPAMSDTTYTLDQLLTLASIIQRESSDTANMPMVSSVFHNRLNNPGVFPSLQSDPTISYVTDNILPELDVKDDGYYAAYSTYICTGLPVGPISNPGLAAIKAAIYPASSNYYFFLTDRDGNFYYAETDAQHEINKEKAGIGAE